jgi:hypothetical protein
VKNYWMLRAIKVVFLAIIAVGVLSLVVMGLWNALMPGIFGAKAVTFWQAVGLLVLSKLLFGGFRPYGGGGRQWRRRMAERWEHMTPEEREKFKHGMRHGCGWVRKEEETTGTAGAQA